LHEINEYFEKQQAYDLFDYMLRELLISQPQDPLQHLIDCLGSQAPAAGPLQVFVSSAPGVGRKDLCRQLADNYGLSYIAAGDLLRDQGVQTDNIGGFADDITVSDIVLEAVLQARRSMQGFVLDGFPRTRTQACKLKELSVVPTHVLVLKASKEAIIERQESIANGAFEGELIPSEVLEAKLNQYTCHSASALESYAAKIKIIDALLPPNVVYTHMERTVRMLPRSKGPGPPPRILILGPRGSGAREHASRLASRLGAVFVDGTSLPGYTRPGYPSRQEKKAAQSLASLSQSTMTSIDLPNMSSLAKEDPLGVVGVRLRQPDCTAQGYVMCGFVYSPEIAKTLAEDVCLCPLRVVILEASVEVCVARLRNIAVDPVSIKVWTTRPRDETIRNRLERSPENTPAAVEASHKAHSENVQGVIAALGSDGRCSLVQADCEPEDVFSNVVEFVERPLPLPASGK
jgi:adenylate kinase